ncbi:MAG: polysaccharide deacetylase family protein [Gemmataceae bacterium]
MNPALLAVTLSFAAAPPEAPRTPIPDRLVVLTFDDASKSHFTVARPALKKYGFGATFLVTEGFDMPTNKRDYMTWEEVAQLHKDGFEIGNHTRDHLSVTAKNLGELAAQVRGLNASCKRHGIPEPASFAYPGNAIHRGALPILKGLGIRFARRGGAPEFGYKEGRGSTYEPGLDHPLLIPSAGDARPGWTLADLKRAVAQARHGRIAVLQFHGVPDTAHDWVNTPRERFEEYMKYLADERCIVIALRDLARYVDPSVTPTNPWGVIEDRQKLLAAGLSGDNARPAKTDAELRDWLTNMARHRFRPEEMAAALGATTAEVNEALRRLKNAPTAPSDRLLVLPYPGGRHPRVGFLDGALRPQRETKASVFAPWAGGGYAVVDVPEAVWLDGENGKPELLYLAHTHVPTVWDQKNVTLPPLEWAREEDGSLSSERVLPNKVRFGAKVRPGNDGVRMELWVANGGDRPLTGLRVQMCVMLKALTGFEDPTNDNKVFEAPFAACRDRSGRRWVITAWEPCVRAWGNPPCPCLHSDPKVPDCPAGQTRRVCGWLSFFEGEDVRAELRRLRSLLPQK